MSKKNTVPSCCSSSIEMLFHSLTAYLRVCVRSTFCRNKHSVPTCLLIVHREMRFHSCSSLHMGIDPLHFGRQNLSSTNNDLYQNEPGKNVFFSWKRILPLGLSHIVSAIPCKTKKGHGQFVPRTCPDHGQS